MGGAGWALLRGELWTTGGSVATTSRLKDIFPGPGGSEPSELLAFDGRLFFRACDPTAGCELWTSDVTLGGTQRFKDILPGTGSGNPQHLVVAGDALYFSACDEAAGCELWVSDGTAARTRRLADIAPGPASSNPIAQVSLLFAVSRMRAQPGACSKPV